jgi:arginase
MAPGQFSEDLYLFFPQWEGSGQTNVYTGATMLRQMLSPRVPFTEIEVEGPHELRVEHDIIGYPHLLRYARQVRHLLSTKKPRRIFPLGGDCGIDLVPISFLNTRYDGDLAVIWLDAHADANTPQTSPSKTFHGMALRTLLGEGAPELVASSFSTLLPHQIFLAGVRDLDPLEQQFLTRAQVQLFPSEQLGAHANALVDAIKKQGFSHVYLHIDVDVLDPVSFPSINTLSHYPTPGGIDLQTLWQIHEAVTSRLSLVGGSLVEVIGPQAGNTHELEPLAAFYAQAFK